jgi:filamentous hemagglutinin family protein
MKHLEPIPKVVIGSGGAQKMRRQPERALSDLPVRLFIDRTSLRVSAALMAALMTFYPVLSLAQSVPAGVTRITPDGRTATTVTTNGSTSTVTTNTISGANAFNSYSQFQIGKGATGNLILPNGTSNLINLVNGSTPTTINGTLNAYKNGQIGGNVYFADPNGFIVGKSGVVNVGALNVTTPTREFMDSVIGAGGQINQGAVGNILAGTVPLSPDGNIRIRGRINAVDAVRLTGQNVAIGSGDASRNQALRFGSTVNSKGLRSADRIVVRNGSVQIVAANDAKINGGVAARRGGTVSVQAGNDVSIGAKGKISVDSKTGPAGSIAVNAGRDIKIAGYGTLSAKSTQGEGGTIVVLAQRNLTVSDNAIVDVSSAQSNAGFVELSAKGTAAIGAININLSAPNGVTGTLLIDPYNLFVGGNSSSGSSDDYTVSSNIQSAGGNIILSADNSITIAAGFYIDSRDAVGTLSLTNGSRGNSGNVTLNARTITINGAIYTNVINTGTNHYNAGNVTLNATETLNISSGSHSANTSITIGSTGIIDASVGGNSTSTTAAIAGTISLLATSTSKNESGLVTANAEINIAGTLTGGNVIATAKTIAEANYGVDAASAMALITQSVFASLLGLNGGWVAATSSAKVNVASTANITATNDVTLTSVSTEKAANPAMVFGVFGLLPWGAAVTVGEINAELATTVDSGAHITALGKLTAQATNDATLAVSALVVTTAGVVDAAAAASQVNINTTANIKSGAVLSVGGVKVLADNENSFSTSATVLALGNSGSVGASLAYSDISTHATANLGASFTIPSTNSAANSAVSVEALSNTTKMSTSSSVSLGTNAFFGAVLGLVPADLLTRIMAPLFGSGFPVKVASALALTMSDQTATATIGDGVGVAPTISTPGDVSVVARTIDRAIRSNADSGTTSKATGAGATQVTVNAGVSYGDYTHTSSATIGHGANITARDIGVNANTDLPNENDWVRSWTDISTPADIFSHLNGNLGVVNNILTSYANASGGDSSQLGAAGSVNYFAATNKATAWVATDAHLTTTGGTAWTTTLNNGDTINWDKGVTINAATDIQTIDVAGSFSALLTGTATSGSSVGGSLNLVFHNNTTIAGIAAGAVVSSTDKVAVNADTHDLFFAISPTSGVAAGTLSLQGIVSYGGINDTTHASIDKNAQISAPVVNVIATEEVSLISVSGSISMGGANGVGISNAILDIRTDTKAFIGANTGDNENDTSTSNVAQNIGYVHADDLSVLAQITGRVTSASVAAVESDPATQAKSLGKQIADTVTEAASFASPTGLFNTDLGISKAANATQQVMKSKPSFSINIAGSSSANIVTMDTDAQISAATITRYSTGSTDKADVQVEALNNTTISAGSGAGAFTFPAAGATGVAIAGAIAVGILNNATTATIDSSSITNAGNVTVLALGSGSQTLVGIGMALAAGSSGYAASMSVSVGIITDSVNAAIKNSTITGNSNAAAADRQLVVQSYQQTDIAIGGGALAVGSTAGLGLTVTYAEIGDPSSGQASAGATLYATTVSQMQNVTVAAGDTARIIAGAATGAGGPDANGLAGALVVALVTNSVSASIGGTSADPKSLNVSGSVAVRADSAYNSGMSALLSQALAATNGSSTVDTGIDFSGAVLNGGIGNSLGASILAVAGVVQAGSNNIGASIVVGTISQTHSAVIEYAYLTVGNTVTVSATDSTKVVGVAVGAGISSGTLAGVASITTDTISSQMVARIGTADDPSGSNKTTVSAGGDVNVVAVNQSNVRSSAGSLGIGVGNAAIGLSIVTSIIKDNVTATIAGGLVNAGHDINVTSASTASILTIAIGVAMAESVGVAGSIATNIESTNVTASISNADVTAQNNAAVLSQNDDGIAVVAGAMGVGFGAVGIGLSVVTNNIGGSTIASISDSKVDALGAGSGTLTVNTGDLNTPIVLDVDSASRLVPPGMSEASQLVHGLAVVATSHQTVTANALTLGFAAEIISAGISVVPVTNVMGGDTLATIDNSQIDTRLTGTNAPQVVVTASSKSFAGNSIVAGGVGSFGGAAANASNQMGRTTKASITSSTVGTTAGGYTGNGPSVAVTAKAYQGAADKVIGFAVGLGGAAVASGIVNVFSADTEAYVDQGTVTAQQLQVTANSANGFFGIAGAGAAGVGIGIASAYVISASENTTLAYVGDNGNVTTINLKGRLAVNAVSTNSFDSSAVGGALAGGTGYAGMVNVIAMSNVTRAGLYRANVTTLSTATQSDTDSSGQAVNNPAGVQVTANETITINPTTGAGAIGYQGEGVGSATNIAVMGSQVIAESSNSQINVPGAVVITANSTKNVNAQTVTFGAGSSRGVGAAIGTILIGNTASAEAMDLLDQNGSGTLSVLNVLSGGGQNYVLSTSGIAAYQTAANASLGHTASAQEVQDYAKGLYTTLLQKGTPGSNGFVLSTSGVAYYASSALSGTTLTNYNTLAGNGSVQNGVFVLTAAGLTAYRSAAATALGITSPTDAQTQAYANGLYQGYVTTINNYANTQYQRFANNGIHFVVNVAGITGLRSEAQAALGLTTTPTDLQVQVYANDRYAALTSATTGSVIGGALVLNATGVTTYAQAALTAPEYTTYQSLTANGSLQGTTFVLNAGDGNGHGVDAFRAAATTSLGHAASDAEVQTYANTQYQTLVQSVKDYANGQYQFLVGNQDATTAADSFSVSSSMSNVRDGITASLAGGTTTAAAVAVSAGGRASTTNMATGVGASIGYGVGAAVAYTEVSTAVAATITQGTVNATTVTAAATMADGSSPASTVKAYAGAGSLSAAVGASRSDAHIDNSLTAALGGTINLTSAGTATASASDTSSVRSDAFGATVGGGLAIGISLADATKTSAVTAAMVAGSQIAGGTSVRFNAANAGAVYAGAVAGVGGGIGAGAGASATATDTSSVTAKVGAGSTINVGTGSVTLSATDVPDAKALALGVAVAVGGTVGASISVATANPTVLAQIDDSVDAAHATRITSGSLNVTATGTYNGTTPATDIPTSASTPSSTSDFQAGGSNAAAWSVAGTGGYFLAVQGTVATANDTASVTANIGDFTVLPTGAVAVNANNTTVQVASGTGVSVSYGGLSIGAVVVTASANTNTSATLGDNVKIGTSALYAQGLTVAANGTDNSTARSTAGSGGMIAGAGANGTTRQTSTVNATLGNNDTLYIATLTLTGAHTDNYKSIVDSTQAATIGASGADAENHASSIVNVSVGQNDMILVSAPTVLINGVGTCDVQACAPGVTVLSQNTFRQVGSQDSAAAAGGGGVNGTGATSTLTIYGETNITFGSGAVIQSGFDPVSSPGAISVLATTSLSGNDSAYLSTGGAIQGAGVTSKLNATVNNNITLNDGVTMTSYGSVTIGTYTNSTASTKALVNTWGAAAVGVAEATTEVTTNQTVTVGAASIFGFDNVYVTAGRYGFGYYDTILNNSSDAHGYVRGVIAIPDATATTNLKNFTSMSLAAGGVLSSAQDVYVGGYTGTLTPGVSSAGHGYELGFIPVTRSNDNPDQQSSSNVALNGTITAGLFHDLNIVISCSDSVLCVNQTSGLPVTKLFDPQYDMHGYVGLHFDSTVAPVLQAGMATGLVPTFFLLGQMYAAGGNVTINANQLSGTGTVRAYGAPTITVTNDSDAYLVIAGGAYIPDVPGGQIIFTGANGTRGTVNTQAQPGTVSAITLRNTYDPQQHIDPNSDFAPPPAPALIVAKDITNLGGVVSISNTAGSYGQSANLSAQQLNVYVPNGAVAVSSTDPSGMYIVGGFPSTEWDTLMGMIYPGGKTITANSATIAANYLANAFYQQRVGSNLSSNPDDLNRFLYGREDDSNVANRNNYGMSHVSEVFLGACVPHTGSCDSGSSEYFFAGSNFFQNITYYDLSKSASSFSSADLSGSRNSYAIYGGQVAIKATIININATIVAGRATNYSINLSSNLAAPLITTVTQINNNNSGCWWCNNQDVVPEYQTTYSGGELALDRQNYITALATNPGADPIYVVSGTGGLVTYNAATNQLSVANINASSGGGNILLDGKVVSTNTVGRIHLNGGYGNVQINNQTGYDLVLNNINTGNALAASALTSTVKIVDRLSTDLNNTTIYNYTPGVGIKIYQTANGLDPLAGAAYTLVQSDTTAFNPIAGTRFQWVMQATIGRTVDSVANTTSAWAFTSGTANAPWVYLKSEYAGTNGDSALAQSALSHLAPGTSPQGALINDPTLTSVAFQEKITGGVTTISQRNIAYHGCGGDNGSECHYGFRQNGFDDDPPHEAHGDWNYNFVTSGWLKLTSSVKADNPIAIDFGGNASGTVNVVSNSNIIVAGKLTNPSGTATLTASRGPQTVFNQTTSNITQTTSQSILTTNLNLVAADAIGSADKPINTTITANSGGTLNAQTGTGDINVNLNSAAKLGLVWAGDPQNGFKDVNIVASGSLTRGAVPQDFTGSAGSDINVRARNINLISSGGSVGSVTDPLKISANATALSGGGVDGGIVNIVANGDIGITQVAANSSYSGDLRVGLIASNSGDVLINVPGGNIYDASGQTAAQALTAAQVDAISQALHLTPLDGAQASALATVTAFDNLMNKSIADYSRIFNRGSKQTGTFTLTTATTEIFRAAVSASLGHTASDAEVQTWANAQFGVFVLDANAIEVFRPQVTAALGHAASDAEVQTWANAKYNASVPTFYQAYGTGFATASALLAALNKYSAYAQLTGNGSVQNGAFVLTGNGLLNYNNTTFQFLTSNGSLQNGVFVLTTAGVVAVGQTALSAPNYATLQLLQSSGAVQNGVYTLTATGSGLLGLALPALNSADYTTFQQLTSSDNSSMQGGVFTLKPAGITAFRAAATAALGHAASDAEVQSYASSRYQTLSGSIQTYAAGQYTTLAAQVQDYANTQYMAVAPFQKLTANGSLQNGVFVLSTAGVAVFGQAALDSTNYAKLQLLQSSGAVLNGVYTLTAAGLSAMAPAALSSANATIFQLLTSSANSLIQSGSLVTLTPTGVQALAQNALTPTNYAAFQQLTSSANSVIQSDGALTLTSAGVLALGQAALSSANYTTLQQLASSTNGSIQGGVLTLTQAGVDTFRAAATAALGRTATDADVQTYASGQYWTLSNAVQTYASGQYQTLSSSVKTYASGQYQTLSSSIKTYASTQYQTLADQVQTYARGQYTTLAQQFQNYANTQYSTLSSTVVYSATPSVALLLLNSSGSVTNGSFVLSATGVLSYASSALTSANYNAFRSLVSNGSVQGGTFLLNQTGLMNTAQAALTADYVNFQNLTTVANGTITNGALVLTAAGIAAFRAAATSSLGHAATDAEVQTYANAQYQAYAATIRANANTQYQAYATTIQSSANAQYQTFAQQIRSYWLNLYGWTIDDIYLASYANGALTGSALAAFQSLYAKGTVTNGVFTLTAANVPVLASSSLGAAAYTSFQTLYSQGSLVNGVFTLNTAGIAAQANTVLTPTYQSFLALGANGAVQYGTYQFNNAGISTYAQSGIAAGAQNFQTLVSNGTVVNGALVLTSGGIINLRSAAAAALGIASPTDDQVQAYANAQYQGSLFTASNAQYQGYVQTVATSARDQYLAYVQRIADYFDSHPNFVRDPANFSLFAQNILGSSDYAKYQALLNNGTAVLGTYVNDVYTGGSYTLNALAAPTVAQQVLPTADYTSYQALLAKGTVQNGNFVLASSNVYQAFQQLAANGTFQNGAFAFTSAGIQSNAQSVLTNAFQQLTGYGSLQGNTFVLGNSGVSYYAAVALTAVNYTAYAGLTSSANGTISNGTLVLNANGLAAFRQAAAAALNISSPTDAQVQTYANAQYQSFTQTIQNYGNTQYQANATQAQTTANTQYQGYAQTIAQYIQDQNSCFLCGGNNNNPPTDADIAQNAQQALTPTQYAAFQSLLAKGAVVNGTLTLNAAGVRSYAADTTAQGQKYTTFQTLTSNGTLSSNGTFTLNASALPTVAPEALDATSYQRFSTLRNQLNIYGGLFGTELTEYNALTQRIQTYANATYQADLQTIQGYANAQYQSYAQTIQVYGASQYNSITAQIQTYANTQYQADVATIQAYGASQYQTLNAAGTTPPPAGLQALVANFGWSTAQLASAIDRSALQPATTTIGDGTANIVGRDVTLNTSGSIGTLAPNVTVDLNDLRNGTISDAQRAALAIATTPGSVTFDGTDNNGQLRTGLVLSSLPNDVNVNNLTKAQLRQTSPVFVSASGKFSATAGTAVYLQSTSVVPVAPGNQNWFSPQGSATLAIGQINAGGDVTVQAPQSILAATSNGAAIYAVQIITANNGNLTLAAGQNIGSAANALAFRIAGNLVAASAGGGDLYLNSVGSGVNIGRVNAQGTASITSSGDIVGYLPGIAITGNSVVLNSQGNVGSAASPLSIKVGLGGNLSGTVAGSAYIFDQILVDPTNPAQLVQDLTVGAFSAAAGLYLKAEAGIVVATSAISANGPVSLIANTGDIMMNVGSQITSGGLVTLASSGDVTLAHVQSTYNPALAAVVVSISAGGSILSNDSAQTNIVANTANGLMSLLAFNDIGSLTHRLSFDATSLSATATSGNIAISGVTSLHATLLSAVNGNVNVVGNAMLTVDSVLAGTAANQNGTFTANATGALTIGTATDATSGATSSGSQLLQAGGDIVFRTLTANGSSADAGNVTVTSTGGKVQGTKVDAHGGATLTAFTTNTGTTATAHNGSLSLTSGGLINWTTLSAAATVDVWSTAGGVTLGTATSGGTQTIRAAQTATFGQLTTNGITGDAGDVLVTAGSIQGGSIAPAAGLARLIATAAITGTGSIVSTKSIELTAGGQINWATLDGKTVTVESTGGSATVGNATSKGTLTLLAKQDAGFTQLTTTGLTGDPSDVIVTTGEGAILGGSITSYGKVALTAGANLAVNSPYLANAKITSTGSITSSTLIALNARGQIDWETLNAATTIDVTSTDGGARVGTATTVGSITMQGKQDVVFDQLTNTAAPGQGDITLTSYNGAILGGSITSEGSVSLIAEGSITATGATASGGQLNWSVLRAGGNMFLRSLGDAITIDDASSGGTLTLWAKYNVTFRQLTTTGAAGDIVLRSDEGAIIALGTGLVNVDATGSVTMNAATTITGTEVRAGGSVGMTAANGRIGWNAVTAGTTVDVRSSANVIDIATITSGGTQTLWAKNNVTFSQLTATAGGADITSDTGAIVGGSVSLAGATRMAAKTTISGTTATSTAGAMEMTAEEMITWNAVNAAGGSLTITSTHRTMDIPSLASGGTMTLDVAQDMAITQITTTGITNDGGDVNVTSHTGRITGGTIAANGGVTLNAPVSITGVSATGATGAVVMNTNGLIDWTTLNAGKQINLRSTGAGVNLGTATSGGTQTIRGAQDVAFTTLTTTGVTGDVGDINVTSDTTKIEGTTVAANGSAMLTAATTNKGTTLTATNGSIGLSANGLIDWATLNAGTQINVRSTGAGVNLGTATSGGTQTIRAAQDVAFTTLTTNGVTGDVGDINVTSDTTKIEGTTIAANGSATLTAATTNKGTGLTARTGSATLRGTGVIDWATLDAGKQIDIRSTGAGVTLGTATSGGSQTIRAAQDVNFNRLATSGTTGDAGDVTVTADAGLIQGVTLNANGSALLTAATTNKGTTLTTATGSATLLAGGLIDWTNINAAKAFTAISGGVINLGTVVSGGTQTLRARDGITFGSLTSTGIPSDQGDIILVSQDGSITGNHVSANGDASFDGGISIGLGTLSGGSVALSTPHDLTINFLQVLRSISLAADTINVTAEQLPSNPPVPLHVTVTGYRGGVATSANLVIDPPEVIIDKLIVTDSVINVDSPNLTITDGYVPGQMLLITPAGDILLANRIPAPSGGVNLQLYQPGGVFSMKQFGKKNFSNTQVVYYDATISSTITNYGGGPFTGSSLVRNIPVDMKNGRGVDFASVEKSGLATFYLLGLPGAWRIDAAQTPTPVEVVGGGPAVNIDGLSKAKKLHETRDRKTVRNRIRSTSLEQGDGVRLDFAATAR